MFILKATRDLEIAFRDALISIAPLRYGAGLKGKVATSFSYGVPVLELI